MKSALAKYDSITEVTTDLATNTCTFKAPKNMDVDAALNDIVASGNEHVKGWSKN